MGFEFCKALHFENVLEAVVVSQPPDCTLPLFAIMPTLCKVLEVADILWKFWR